MIVKCPNCQHEFESRRTSTLKSPALDIPIREDAPMCLCGHVRILHDETGKCTLCECDDCTAEA